MKMVNYLARQSRSIHIAVGLVAVALVGLLQRLTGPEVSFAILYLIPISQVTWFAGRLPGVVLAVFSAAVGLVVDLTEGLAYSSPAIPFLNTAVRLGLFLVVALALAALRSAVARLRGPAETGRLTGAANEKRFHESIQLERSRALRYKHPLTLMYVDVDDFEHIGEHSGGRPGDELLRLVATTIRDNIRSIDTLGHIGGGEFGILLVESKTDQAQSVIGRIREDLLAAAQQDNWPVTFSFGAVTFFSPVVPVDEMIRMVDALMATVRSEGKNAIKYEVYSD